jgi:hypothetical protein
MAREAVRWADELDKLVDPATGRVPRSQVRMMEGAWFARQEPEILNATFFQQAREFAQQVARDGAE